MSKALTTEVWVERAKQNVKNKHIDYSRVRYINQATPVMLFCVKHAHKFTAPPKQHANGESGCRYCGQERKIAGRKATKMSVSDLQRLIREKGKGLYTVPDVSTYKGIGVKMRFVCSLHGDRWQTPSNYLNSLYECERCAVDATKTKLRIDKEEWWKRVKRKHGDKFEYPNWEVMKIESQFDTVEVVCPEHGSSVQQIATHIRGNGCPGCGKGVTSSKQTKTFSYYLKKFRKKHLSDLYTYDTKTYVNSSTKMRIICTRHGEFWQTPFEHTKYGCYLCGRTVSFKENDLFEFVKRMHPDAKQRNRSLIKPKELDIIIPSKRIAIEYNGLYWHTTRKLSPDYHKTKSDLCKEKGIRLIHIWEDDWKEKQDVVKSFLAATLTTIPTVYGRETRLKEISKSVAKTFLERNHIQGSTRNTLSTGLFHEDSLVSVCSFTRGKEHWELVRHACKKNIRVLGALGKHTKNFLKTHTNIKLISFCDLSMFTGTSYEAAGFKLDKALPPDYKYVIKNKRKHKFNFRRKYLPKFLGEEFKPELSEVQNMELNGYYRVFDCGKARYVVES